MLPFKTSRMHQFPTVCTLALLVAPLSYFNAVASEDEGMQMSSLQCWQEEEFTVVINCGKCSPFQMNTLRACQQTGFIEAMNCSRSNLVQHKGCRLTWMEERLFWRFEFVAASLTAVFVLLVTGRQRALDRRATEKVRRQIQSI